MMLVVFVGALLPAVGDMIWSWYGLGIGVVGSAVLGCWASRWVYAR